MRRQPAPNLPIDAVVANLAAAQHGAVSAAQLRGLGMSPSQVRNRLRAGRLHAIHRGVYAVGHAGLSREGRWRAATLALGSGALLSHRSAAALWGMLRDDRGPAHVSLPRGGGRNPRSGVVIHHPRRSLEPARTAKLGIPVTNPQRTVDDLRRVEPAHVVRRAIRQAEQMNLPLLAPAGDRTRSDLERSFLRLCRRHGIPRPIVNSKVAGYEVDFLWPAEQLIVETDGYIYHRGRQAFSDDRDRDLDLSVRGYRVHRVADTRISRDPRGVATAIRTLIRIGGAG